MDGIVLLVMGGILVFLTTIGPFLITPAAIWIGLLAAEKLAPIIPLIGKPLSTYVFHPLRNLYQDLLKWCWKWIAKFFNLAWKGFVKLVKKGAKWLFPNAWRGFKRLAGKGRERLRGSTPPPPAPPPPP